MAGVHGDLGLLLLLSRRHAGEIGYPHSSDVGAKGAFTACGNV
jgi:hypothetical protein